MAEFSAAALCLQPSESSQVAHSWADWAPWAWPLPRAAPLQAAHLQAPA